MPQRLSLHATSLPERAWRHDTRQAVSCMRQQVIFIQASHVKQPVAAHLHPFPCDASTLAFAMSQREEGLASPDLRGDFGGLGERACGYSVST